MKGQAKPFPFEREHTPNGVIVATDSERHLAFSVKWTGSEPGTTGELAALALARADSASDFRAALARWKLPAVEIVYAAVDGAAGRQATGLLPVRSSWDGALPAPGWSGTFEWRGWRRLDELPHAVMPTTGGFFVSANQNTARTNRLDDVLGGAQPQTVEDFKRMQLDTTAWNAEQLVPLLATLASDRSEVEAARRMLVQWDKRISADSVAARVYVSWERELLRKLAEARLAPDLRTDYIARAGLPIAALTTPSSLWFDDDPVRARDRLLLDALAAAIDPAGAPRPFGTGFFLGQPAHTDLQASPRDHAGGPASIQRRPVRARGLPRHRAVDVSLRRGDRRRLVQQVVDLSNWDRSLWINAPGSPARPGADISPISPSRGRPASIFRWPSAMPQSRPQRKRR